jgi:DNA repair protein RadC
MYYNINIKVFLSMERVYHNHPGKSSHPRQVKLNITILIYSLCSLFVVVVNFLFMFDHSSYLKY